MGLMDTLMMPRFGSFNPSREHLVNMITDHNAAVQAHIPAEQLLIFEVREGWEPLCTFLEHPIPSTDFPYENIGDDFIKQRLKQFVGLGRG